MLLSEIMVIFVVLLLILIIIEFVVFDIGKFVFIVVVIGLLIR